MTKVFGPTYSYALIENVAGMATNYTDQLLMRADKAITDAIAIRAEVQAGLIAAGQRRTHWPYGYPSHPPFPDPVDWDALELWWAVARTLGSAKEMVRAADEDLEREWQRILPTIETPVDLFRTNVATAIHLL